MSAFLLQPPTALLFVVPRLFLEYLPRGQMSGGPERVKGDAPGNLGMLFDTLAGVLTFRNTKARFLTTASTLTLRLV